MHEPTDSDKFQGVIRNPIAFYFPIQRGFSGSIQTLPIHGMSVGRVLDGLRRICSILQSTGRS